jgi:hypothetical protein
VPLSTHCGYCRPGVRLRAIADAYSHFRLDELPTLAASAKLGVLTQIMERGMITLLRTGALFLVMTSAACVTADTSANSSDLEIVMGRTSLDGRPMLAMHVRNRSEGPVCILADKLQNPYTSEIEFRLRDARGYRMQLEPSGYILEPPNGVMRLEPGMSADARYDLITRFRNLGEGRPLPAGLVAQIAFQYGNCQQRPAYCDGDYGMCTDIWSRRAVSSWQRI